MFLGACTEEGTSRVTCPTPVVSTTCRRTLSTKAHDVPDDAECNPSETLDTRLTLQQHFTPSDGAVIMQTTGAGEVAPEVASVQAQRNTRRHRKNYLHSNQKPRESIKSYIYNQCSIRIVKY